MSTVTDSEVRDLAGALERIAALEEQLGRLRRCLLDHIASGSHGGGQS